MPPTKKEPHGQNLFLSSPTPLFLLNSSNRRIFRALCASGCPPHTLLFSHSWFVTQNALNIVHIPQILSTPVPVLRFHGWNFLSLCFLFVSAPSEAVVNVHQMVATAWCQWLTPVILATWEAEVGRIWVGGQPGQIVLQTLSRTYQTQKRGW
jgi:hypothetical protein